MNMITKNKIKELKKLNNKKFRKESNSVLVEGDRTINQILSYGIKPELVLQSENYCLPRDERLKELQYIVDIVPEGYIEQLSQTKNPQELIAVFRKPNNPIPEKGIFIYLDNLRDPGNLGTIFRTAASFSIDGIILSENSCEVLSPKVIRASLGSVFSVPFITKNLSEINLNDYEVFVADMKGDSVLEVHSSKNINTIIVIGNEANGVSDSVKKLATNLISIPMSANMESLNASIAASIIMFSIIKEKYGPNIFNR